MASYISGREPSNLGPIVILVSLVFAMGGGAAWLMSSMQDAKKDGAQSTAQTKEADTSKTSSTEGMM
jgi:hypothetical protein